MLIDIIDKQKAPLLRAHFEILLDGDDGGAMACIALTIIPHHVDEAYRLGEYLAVLPHSVVFLCIALPAAAGSALHPT